MNLPLIIGLVVGGAALAVLAWYSVQSLRQAMVLKRRAGSLPAMRNRAVALRGRVRITDPIRTAGGIPCLWRRQVIQERSGWGRRRSWRTVSDEKQTAGFVVQAGATEIEVGDPTEVQGTESQTDGERVGFVDSFFGGVDSRCTEHWLPVVPDLTVLGRLEQRPDGWHLVPDRTLGLLVSPHSPERAATWESVKGWTGLAAVVAGIIGAIWLVAYFR